MTSRPPPLSLRLAELEDEVTSRGDSPGVTIKRDLHRYYQLMRSNIPSLTTEEGLVALRAIAGQSIDPTLLWAQLSNSGADEFATRVRTMSPLEQLALTDALERAERLRRQRHPELEALRKSGLI